MESRQVTDQHLFFVWKILDGALRGDREKVASYAQHLLSKFETDGDTANARRLKQLLQRGTTNGLAAVQRASPDSGLSRLPVDSESRLPVADEERWRPGSIRLVLEPSVRAQVDRFIRHFRAAERLAAAGATIAPSMLLHGPPGTGKTQVARFIAAELELPLVISRSDALISSYLGSTAKNVRILFEHAAARPCVLFLDEFDAIAKMRDDGQELGELKRVVIGLLQNIDATGRDHVLLAATNHPHLLDKAIWRRFAYHVELRLPNREERFELWKWFLNDRIDDEGVTVAAAVSKGLSGAQIRDISEDAMREAILTDRPIAAADLLDGVIAARGNRPGRLSTAEKIRVVVEGDADKVTQQSLARVFGVSQPYVSRLLKRERD